MSDLSSIREVPITTTIAGRQHRRADVLAWENRRIDAAARKLGIAAPAKGPIAKRRIDWLGRKRDLGPAEIVRRLRRDLRAGDAFGVAQSRVTGRRRASWTDLFVPGADAQGFLEWFTAATERSDEDAMLRANPDHFVIRTVDGLQEVVETTGGSPFATRFTVDYDDVSSLVTPIDPAFPVRLDGVARAMKGLAIGGVRHQFRDEADGVHARVLVEFPFFVPPTVIRGHRWHLAAEFSNWFEHALADGAGPGTVR